MQKPMEWHPKQLKVLGYAYHYGIEDLGYTLEQILELIGITRTQWQARWDIDIPAMEGRSRSEVPIDSWRDDWETIRRTPREELREQVLTYLENMARRKGF